MTSRFSVVPLAFLLTNAASAQCGPVISTFPYNEGFESVAAWTSGGLNNDWEWGQPAHPLINSAGGGTKSWCAGGLTGQFYEFDAQSWIMSPCFDFTSLQRPWISLKIFWESERRFDGLVLQSSLNEGATWTNVGAYGDPVNCLNTNWYNEDDVTNIDNASPPHGWSGRVGPSAGGCLGTLGSATWLTATHCMNSLGGEPSVRFRFLFGSGSVCNDYDGIAIDDILIQESPLLDVDISHVCAGSTFTFTGSGTICPLVHSWNFGDPGSGSSNTASGSSVDHTYSGPGTYTVSLSLADPCGPLVVRTEEVVVLGVELVSLPSTCGAANGSLQASVVGSNGPFTYDWEPGSGSSTLLSGLLPGNYSVTITAPGASCPTTVQGGVLDAPSTLELQVIHSDVSCGGASDGEATVQVSGGIAQTYTWFPSGGSGPTALNLSGGDYTITVTDVDGCSASENVTILEAPVLTVGMDPEVDLCAGASTVLQPTGIGGIGPYVFTWFPNGPEVSPAETTAYQVSVTDADGCISEVATVSVNVGSSPVPSLIVNDPLGCSPHCVSFLASPVGLASYVFEYGDGMSGIEPAHCYTGGGLFDVVLTVTNNTGCSGTAVFNDLVEVIPSPIAGFIAPAIRIITDDPLRLVDASFGASEWSWDLGGANGNDTSASPVLTFPLVGCYTLQQVATSDAGCADTAVAQICVENEFAVFAPNAFTPNGDGVNEVFDLVTSVREPIAYELLVFNRWGEQVFTSSDISNSWTGDGALDGMYAWVLSMRDSENRIRKATGHVLLLR